MTANEKKLIALCEEAIQYFKWIQRYDIAKEYQLQLDTLLAEAEKPATGFEEWRTSRECPHDVAPDTLLSKYGQDVWNAALIKDEDGK